MIYSPNGLMRYNDSVAIVDDMPLLSQWITKKNLMFSHQVLFCVGIYLSSQAAARQVFSAQVSLTSVFGMGTGGPSPQSTPTMTSYPKVRYIKQ